MSTVRSNEEWLAIIRKCRESGLSDKAWCRTNGISISAFYYNIRKLRRLMCEIPAGGNSPGADIRQEVVPLVITDDPVTGIAPSRRNEDACIPEPLLLRIECGGISVTCPDGLSPSTLCSVIRALRMEC